MILINFSFFFFFFKHNILFCTGLSEENIRNCVEWMSVYWSVILDKFQYEKFDFENDTKRVDGTYDKLNHLSSMDLYVSVVKFFLSPSFTIQTYFYS